MVKKLLIRNGRVICPASGIDRTADVLIEDGRIAAVGEELSAPGAETLDATGLVVAPGFIDIHDASARTGLHPRRDHRARARRVPAGGFTTVCCMPNTNR